MEHPKDDLTVMIRSRLADEESTFGEPFKALATCDLLPRVGDQMIYPHQDRAFLVTTVEWRYDLDQIHLFCIEYPREAPPPTPLKSV